MNEITLNQKINLKKILKINEIDYKKIVTTFDTIAIVLILESEFYDINELSVRKYVRERDFERLNSTYQNYSINDKRQLSIKNLYGNKKFHGRKIKEYDYDNNYYKNLCYAIENNINNYNSCFYKD